MLERVTKHRRKKSQKNKFSYNYDVKIYIVGF